MLLNILFIRAAKRSADVLHKLATKKQYVLSELTNISKMDKTVLADVGTSWVGASLWHWCYSVYCWWCQAEMIHTTRQVHIKHRAQLLQQLRIQKEIF